jgi:threonine/homoserine/homoserine lactone efflux protein
LVNGILFAGFPLTGFSLQQEILIKALIINLVWIPVHFFWLWLGIKLRQWGLSKGKQAIVNKVMAFCLFVVIALAGLSEF